MTVFLRHNRRLLACLMTLAMLAMASSVRASWQCLNGMPCPSGHPMQAASCHPPVRATQAMDPAHACCQVGRQAQKGAPAASSATVGASKGCILHIQPAPEARAQAPASAPLGVTAPAVLPLPVPVLVPEETSRSAFGRSDVTLFEAFQALLASRAPPSLR